MERLWCSPQLCALGFGCSNRGRADLCPIVRGDCRGPSSVVPQYSRASRSTSPPPAQSRIFKFAVLPTPRLATDSKGGGMAGIRGTPRPEVPQPKGRKLGQKVGGGTRGGQTLLGWTNRRGSERLRSPGRACPATRTNRSHIQGESSSVRLLSLPLLTAPEPMARRGGRAGRWGR